MTKFYRFIRFLVSLVIKPLYPVKVFGQRKLDEKKTLLAINHLSNLDPVLAGCYLKPQLHFWAKRELFKNKFFGSVLRKLGAVPINRGEADIASIKSALTLLKDGKIFTLFPEGTRNKAGETDADMLQIKNGLALLAIKSQSPIRAALFYRKPKVFRRNYLIIGDEFSLETFYGQKISADVLSEASKIIGQKFDELREKFDALLTEKGVKKIENPSA